MFTKLNIQNKIHNRRLETLDIWQNAILGWFKGKFPYYDYLTIGEIENWKLLFELYAKYHKYITLPIAHEDQVYIYSYFT